MSGARPGDPVSPQSRAWLRRVRANVREQLFGSSPSSPAPETPPPSAAPEPGQDPDDPTRIGRFVVIKRIGEGGMGMVFAAYDDALDRKVAVKLLHPRGSGQGSDARTRLIREAQALARLSHPSVIHVYEVGTWQEQVYVAMEFVDGGTLGQWQRQEGRSWREVLDAYVAAGRGLAAAHAAGIVHRDFKAANVLVRRDGAVRVVDFGLARQEMEAGASTSSPRPVNLEVSGPSLSLVSGDSATAPDAPLTRTGVIMGTPAYMAPEQHLGQRADPRSDQFSFCISLYEALYGYRPFAGENLPALRRNVLAGRIEQPPRYTDIPPRILRVLERGLQQHPHDRYPAMEPLLDDLVYDPRIALRRALYLLLALALVGIAVGIWWSEREERAARAEGAQLRAQFERARILNAEEELRRAQSRTVSQKYDDLVLAYAREVIDDNPTVALAALKHLTPENAGWLPAARTIAADALQRGVIHRAFDPKLGRIAAMEFTPNGKILVLAGRGLALWSTSAESLFSLDSKLVFRDMALAADGRRLAAVGQDEAIHLWELPEDLDGPVSRRRIESKDGPLLSVALSSDGEQLAVGAQDGTVRLLDWAGASKRAIDNHKGPIRSLDFSPGAEQMVSASDDGTIRLWFLDRETHWELEHGPGVLKARFDGDGQALWSTAEDGTVRRWSTSKGKGRPVPDLAGATLLAHAPSSALTLACRGERELTLHGRGDPQPLRGLPALVTTLALSPDGTWAAASTGDEQVQVWRLVGMDGGDTQADGSRITPTRGPITALAFSRAGSLLASASRHGAVELWSEQGEWRGVLGQHTRTILSLDFSPQGHELAAHDEDGGIIVWSVADRDQEPLLLRNRGSTRSAAWTWSPDGDVIAAPRCESREQCEVVVYPISSDEPIALPVTDSPALALRFSPGGTYLLTDHPTGSWLWNLFDGTGRALDWPDDDQPPRRLAFAWVDGGVRMATADTIRDLEGRAVSITLRVWHIGQDSGAVHLLFEEPELRELLVDAKGNTLLLRTHDDRSLLWRLSGDRFRVLPTVGGLDRLLVSPDSRALLLRPNLDRERDSSSWWVDIESGQMRRFSRRNDPMAWSARGTIADVPGAKGLRIWRDPTPGEAGAFIRWLGKATNVTVALETIR